MHHKTFICCKWLLFVIYNIRSFCITIVQICIKKFLPFRAVVSVCAKICNYKKHWIFAVFSAFILFRTRKYDMISIIQSNTRLCKQTHDFFQQNWGVRMHTNESAENYLETILILSKSHPVVRSVDVASELGFKKSSVSVAYLDMILFACVFWIIFHVFFLSFR